MGRPPIGKQAMSGAERTRKYREKLRHSGPVTKYRVADTAAAEIAALKRRIAELERRGDGQLTRSTRGEARTEFTEGGKLRAENTRLKSDIIKLKAMLQEEPDAAKLRKKVVDLQVETGAMRRELRKVAKERDRYQALAKGRGPKYREARHLLTRQSYNVIIKALHSDRTKHVTAAELAEAERLATALRPLFDEG